MTLDLIIILALVLFGMFASLLSKVGEKDENK